MPRNETSEPTLQFPPLTADELEQLRTDYGKQWSGTSWNGYRWQRAIATIDALQAELERQMQINVDLRDKLDTRRAHHDKLHSICLYQPSEGQG